MPQNTSIDSLVSQFVTDLSALMKRSALEQVLSVLQAGGAAEPARRGPGRPRGSGSPKAARAGKGGKRSPEEMERMTAQLLDRVKTNPGERGEQIAAALGTDVKTMRLPMLKLIADGKIRTEGQRRGMSYFAGAGGGGARKAKKAGRRRAKKRGS